MPSSGPAPFLVQALVPSWKGSPASWRPLPFVSVNFSPSHCLLPLQFLEPATLKSSQRSGMDQGFRHCTLQTDPARAAATAATLPSFEVLAASWTRPLWPGSAVKYSETTERVTHFTIPYVDSLAALVNAVAEMSLTWSTGLEVDES